jgi:Putative auto-transporter adhesin, head GIN domain
MKTKFLFVFPFIFGSLAGYSQDTLYRELPPFTVLHVTDNITVQLNHTGKESVSIHTIGLDPQKIQTRVEKNILTIGLAGSVYSKQKIMVNLNFKEIREMDIRNNAEVITTSLFKADSLAVTLKLGGSLYLEADLGYLKSNVSGGGLLTAEGYATRQDIFVSSRSTVSAYELESESIRIEAISGGKAKINVENELDATATTGSYISYKGGPVKKNISATEGSEVVAGEE